MQRTRIVVMGDPHIGYPADADWEVVVSDINGLTPDKVLVVGDLSGYGPSIGTYEATWHAAQILNGLNAPWHSIIGNHDLEAKAFASDEAAVASFLKAVGRTTPWFREEVGAITVLGLSTTSWRRNAECQHEVVFEEDQLVWFEEQLEELQGKPVFVIGHTPPIGSGLITMPELHGKGGNMVVNQNGYPGRIMNIIWRYPNILAWFSGHNHLGHHYRNAIAVTLGVHFVQCGVAGTVSKHRDGCRHTRVVDIHADSIDILTYDHKVKRMDTTCAYHEPNSLQALLDWREAHKGQLYIPRDPESLRQGPPLA